MEEMETVKRDWHNPFVRASWPKASPIVGERSFPFCLRQRERLLFFSVVTGENLIRFQGYAVRCIVRPSSVIENLYAPTELPQLQREFAFEGTSSQVTVSRDAVVRMLVACTLPFSMQRCHLYWRRNGQRGEGPPLGFSRRGCRIFLSPLLTYCLLGF